jgi:uncharacterized integral membrane protein
MSETPPPAPSAPRPPDEGRRRAPSGLAWRTIALAVLVVYAVVFLILNDESVEIDFVFFSATTRKIWLILLSMALGAVIALLGPRFLRWRRERRGA